MSAFYADTRRAIAACVLPIDGRCPDETIARKGRVFCLSMGIGWQDQAADIVRAVYDGKDPASILEEPRSTDELMNQRQWIVANGDTRQLVVYQGRAVEGKSRIYLDGTLVEEDTISRGTIAFGGNQFVDENVFTTIDDDISLTEAVQQLHEIMNNKGGCKFGCYRGYVSAGNTFGVLEFASHARFADLMLSMVHGSTIGSTSPRGMTDGEVSAIEDSLRARRLVGEALEMIDKEQFGKAIGKLSESNTVVPRVWPEVLRALVLKHQGNEDAAISTLKGCYELKHGRERVHSILEDIRHPKSINAKQLAEDLFREL